MPEGDEIVPIGVAATRREGDDITLLTYGAMVQPSLEAADRLAKEGVEVEVIDLRTLLPFDKDAIFASVEKTSRVLIVHEDVKTLGIGAELSAVIMEERFDALDAPVMRVTYPDTHCPFSQVLEAGQPAERRQDQRRAPEAGGVLRAGLKAGPYRCRCAKGRRERRPPLLLCRGRPSGRPEDRRERFLQPRVLERKAQRSRFRRDRALARQKQRVRHFAEYQPQRERGGGHEGGTSKSPPERARELHVPYGLGCRDVQRPGGRIGPYRAPDKINPVRSVNPGPVLATRTNRPTDAELERWKHLRKRTTVTFED